ncbi:MULTISPECIES: hypothetical protein [unclassified Streptomyces]|uniref:hypothetical protein n=1 Tax=unclassified Streptomyces TaxID=2593676 RepID=UPI0022B5ED8B|nr:MULTISPECIES: hypothetical protein [unclassified Streptomyces]MCZ7416659.1 hypothetical protein [Streptomyces sp. WMMC897]MCZ7433531.1 hypothetical protein [Streptomyces sp. WMMC1477]
MNAPGTIDSPAAYGPTQQDPMNDTDFTARGRSRDEWPAITQNRTRKMQLMPETLSRARIQQYRSEAREEQLACQIVLARRMQRKAERASLKARRALARTVMY